jgi:hypothetical protein
MSISIPLHAKISFNSPRIDDEPILLLTISDSTLSEDIRLCSQPLERITSSPPLKYGIMSGGLAFEYALTGSIPSDQEGVSLTTTLTIDNMDMELTQSFLGLTAENEAQVDLILASEPDTLIRSFPLMVITQVDLDEQNITITLERNRKILGEPSALEPYPSGLQTYQQAPGLHR